MKWCASCTCLWQFRATIDGNSQPVLITKEIYIGTVPLVIRPPTTSRCKSPTWDRASYGDWTSMDDDAQCAALVPGPPYYCSPAIGYPCGEMSYSSGCRFSLTDLIAATVSSVSSAADPSAPLLAVLEGSTDEHRPPPFAPGHNDEVKSIRRVTSGETTEEEAVSIRASHAAIDPSLREFSFTLIRCIFPASFACFIVILMMN